MKEKKKKKREKRGRSGKRRERERADLVEFCCIEEENFRERGVTFRWFRVSQNYTPPKPIKWDSMQSVRGSKKLHNIVHAQTRQ